ncbi:hypothetical protein PMAYCL1PPCAC_08179, partial [Pristionchus mayeri]
VIRIATRDNSACAQRTYSRMKCGATCASEDLCPMPLIPYDHSCANTVELFMNGPTAYLQVRTFTSHFFQVMQRKKLDKAALEFWLSATVECARTDSCFPTEWTIDRTPMEAATEDEPQALPVEDEGFAVDSATSLKEDSIDVAMQPTSNKNDRLDLSDIQPRSLISALFKVAGIYLLLHFISQEGYSEYLDILRIPCRIIFLLLSCLGPFWITWRQLWDASFIQRWDLIMKRKRWEHFGAIEQSHTKISSSCEEFAKRNPWVNSAVNVAIGALVVVCIKRIIENSEWSIDKVPTVEQLLERSLDSFDLSKIYAKVSENAFAIVYIGNMFFITSKIESDP